MLVYDQAIDYLKEGQLVLGVSTVRAGTDRPDQARC
jgi:hypothetical protein